MHIHISSAAVEPKLMEALIENEEERMREPAAKILLNIQNAKRRISYLSINCRDRIGRRNSEIFCKGALWNSKEV